LRRKIKFEADTVDFVDYLRGTSRGTRVHGRIGPIIFFLVKKQKKKKISLCIFTKLVKTCSLRN